MYLNILKKDLKRKKAMNTVLLLFIIIAVMFVASGLNNVLTVAEGTDHYLDKAGVGNFVFMTAGDDSLGNSTLILDKADCIKNYKIEKYIFGSQGSIKHIDGKDIEIKNTPLFQSIENAKMNFFDSENQPITEISEGEVYISGKFISNNGFTKGDYIRVNLGDVEMNLKIAGKTKDALLGSDYVGRTRFLINEKDYQKLLSDETIKAHYQGEIVYIQTNDISKTISVTSDIPKVSFNIKRNTMELSYVMDKIVAFVVLILSVCLIIVSFVVLRFSIGFTIAEEYREIGIMKAIGLKSRKIRGLYIVKYLILSVVGGIIGFFASIPFGKMLLMSVSDNMVLDNDIGILINIVSAIGTMAIILLFAYGCTGKVNKLTPIDAIRSGQTGERFKKKTIFRIGNTNANPSFYMAINDILSSPKRFTTIIVSFFICTLFVLMMVNTTATMNSSKLITSFGTKSDLYVTDEDTSMKLMNMDNVNDMQKTIDEMKKELADNGMPADIGFDVWYKYKLTSKGNDFSITCNQSVNISANEYEYYEGTAPQNKNEIAITPQISEKLDAKIGDTVTIDFGKEKLDCIITAYFQSMMQLGNIIRLSDDAPTDTKYMFGISQYQIDFKDNPSIKEIENRKEKIKELYNNEDVMNATEYCADYISVVPVLKAVQRLLLAITIVVVILVTILVERSFISDERSQIAILKAIGFKTKDIINWHTLRFGASALIAAVLAALTSIPMTKLCITPVFGMMGANKVDFNIDPFKIFFIYPAIIFTVTVIIALLTSLHTKKIKTSEATNIE